MILEGLGVLCWSRLQIADCTRPLVNSSILLPQEGKEQFGLKRGGGRSCFPLKLLQVLNFHSYSRHQHGFFFLKTLVCTYWKQLSLSCDLCVHFLRAQADYLQAHLLRWFGGSGMLASSWFCGGFWLVSGWAWPLWENVLLELPATNTGSFSHYRELMTAAMWINLT